MNSIHSPSASGLPAVLHEGVRVDLLNDLFPRRIMKYLRSIS